MEWTQEEEAKREAALLAAEVEQLQKEATSTAQAETDSGGKRGRSKSPRKDSSRFAFKQFFVVDDYHNWINCNGRS